MTERLGDRRMQEVLRLHNDIVREHLAASGGFEVKSMGDGFMLAFSSAGRALQCAVAIQTALLLTTKSKTMSSYGCVWASTLEKLLASPTTFTGST